MFSLFLSAQIEFETGVIPKFTSSIKVLPNTKWVSTLGIRNFTSRQNEINYDFAFLEWTNAISYKSGPRQKLNLAYAIRLKEEGYESVFIQQLSRVNQFEGFRIGHRFGLREYIDNEGIEYQFRYRLNAEIAIFGQDVNYRELYYKPGTTIINVFSKDNRDLELRLSSFLGIQLARGNKCEIGFESRFNKFIDGPGRSRTFLVLAWYKSFG